MGDLTLFDLLLYVTLLVAANWIVPAYRVAKCKMSTGNGNEIPLPDNNPTWLQLFASLWVAGGLVMLGTPYQTIDGNHWPSLAPIVVTNPATGETCVSIYRRLESIREQNPGFVMGVGSAGCPSTFTSFGLWKSVEGQPWNIEVRASWEAHHMVSRFNMRGTSPVLVEYQDTGPGTALLLFPVAAILVLLLRYIRPYGTQKLLGWSGCQAMAVNPERKTEEMAVPQGEDRPKKSIPQLVVRWGVFWIFLLIMIAGILF